MTKFLTALLIAGISATAEAEPVAYFCNTVSYGQVKTSEIKGVRSYPIKLLIDRPNRTVKVLLEGWETTITDGIVDNVVTPMWPDGEWPDDHPGNDEFFAHGLNVIVNFEDGVLAFSKIAKIGFGKERIVSSSISSCEKF